jgi:uncharacterized protein
MGGILDGTYAPAHTPSDLGFEESLEPAVRPLVLALIKKYGVITYTSCEGHLYPDIEGRNSLLHVGMLVGYGGLEGGVANIKSVVDNENLQSYLSGASARLLAGDLLDELTGRRYKTVDLYLLKNTPYWSIYFENRSKNVEILSESIFG